MQTVKWIVAVSLLGMFLGSSGVSFWPRQAQEMEEGSEEEESLKEADIQFYIDVYTAMQKDHGLVLDKVLEEKGVSVAQFRSIEQKVQRQPRLVERVRKSLVEAAMARAGEVQKPSAMAKK